MTTKRSGQIILSTLLHLSDNYNCKQYDYHPPIRKFKRWYPRNQKLLEFTASFDKLSNILFACIIFEKYKTNDIPIDLDENDLKDMVRRYANYKDYLKEDLRLIAKCNTKEEYIATVFKETRSIGSYYILLKYGKYRLSKEDIQIKDKKKLIHSRRLVNFMQLEHKYKDFIKAIFSNVNKALEFAEIS